MSKDKILTSEPVGRRDFTLGICAAAGSVMLGCAVSGEDEATGVDGQATELTVENVAQMRRISGARTGMRVRILGFAERGDGGEGVFTFQSQSDKLSAVADDVGYLVRGSGSPGWWQRVTDSKDVSVKWFGARGDGSHSDTEAVGAAATTAARLDGRVMVPEGTYRIDGLGRKVCLARVPFATDSAAHNPVLLEQVPSTGLTISYYPISA